MISHKQRRGRVLLSAAVAALAAFVPAFIRPALAGDDGKEQARVAFPATPAGHRAHELLHLFNGDIGIEPKEFVRQNCSDVFKQRVPEPAWGGAIIQVKSMAGKVELVSIEDSKPYSISFTIRSISRGVSFRIDVVTAPDAPYAIDAMGFFPAGHERGARLSAPDPAPARASGAAPDLTRVSSYLAEQARLGRFSGAALVAKDGKVLLEEAAGLASKRFRVPNTVDTRFNLGSINKIFTAVAVLQLVEAGTIGIDDPIGKYLDEFPVDIGRKVTVRHLLTMGSGWGDYWNHPYFLQNKDRLRTVSDHMEFITTIPLDFEPGTSIQHSNTGYEVAGALIEKVSGMDYFDYIREHVYAPAGMTRTDSYDRDGQAENLAVGYTNMHPLGRAGQDYQWENTYILPPRGTPAGGGYSTVGDMLKFDIALRAGKLMGTTYVDFLNNGFQGRIGDSSPRQIRLSAGGANGVSSLLARDLRDGYTVVVLTNLDNPAAIDIGRTIIEILGLE